MQITLKVAAHHSVAVSTRAGSRSADIPAVAAHLSLIQLVDGKYCAFVRCRPLDYHKSAGIDSIISMLQFLPLTESVATFLY